MKKVKKILLVFAIIFASLSFLALFLPFFIDLNRFKPKIQALVAEKMNAKLDFAAARINFFGGIGVKLRDVSFENTAAPFVGEKIFSAQNVDVQFEFLPLFSKKIIGVVYLDKPTVQIIKIGNKDTISSLTKPPSETKNQKPSDDSSSSYTLVLNEFNVENAHILFKDLTTKSSPTTIDMQNINIDMVRNGDIVDIQKLSMKLFSGQFTSHAKINLADPEMAYSGDCELKNFSLVDIYKSFAPQNKKSPFEGIATVNMTFDGRGTTKEVYSKALNAQGKFKIKSGSLQLDTSMPAVLDQLGKFLASLPIPGFHIGISKDDLKKAGDAQNTNLSLHNMQGNFEIKKGVLFLKNQIPMNQGLLQLDTTIGVFTSSLKGTVVFIANESYTKTLVAANKNFTYLLDKNDKLYVKVFLAGTVGDPQITVDTSDILANILRRGAKSLLNPLSIPTAIKDTLKNIFVP